jgi:hypothetical protein
MSETLTFSTPGIQGRTGPGILFGDGPPTEESIVAAVAERGLSPLVAEVMTTDPTGGSWVYVARATRKEYVKTDGSWAETGETLASDAIVQAAAVATAADRVATGQDRVATGQDRVQTGLDRVATGQDLVATTAERVLAQAARTGAETAETNANSAANQIGAYPTFAEAEASTAIQGRTVEVYADGGYNGRYVWQSGELVYMGLTTAQETEMRKALAALLGELLSLEDIPGYGFAISDGAGRLTFGLDDAGAANMGDIRQIGEGEEVYLLGRLVSWFLRDANKRSPLLFTERGEAGIGDILQLPGGDELFVGGIEILRYARDLVGRVTRADLMDGSTGIAHLRQLPTEDDWYFKGREVLWPARDVNGRLLSTYLKDGSFWVAKLEVGDGSTIGSGYVDPGTLTGPGNVFAARSVNAGLAQFLADGEGVVRSYLQRTDIASTTAMFETAGPIVYHPTDGESMEAGGVAGSPTVINDTATYPHYCLMLNTGARGAQSGTVSASALIDFVPIVEAVGGSFNGETAGAGWLYAAHAAELAAHEADPTNVLRVHVFRTAAANGRMIAEIEKGTEPYANGLKELTATIAIAAAYGKTVWCPAWCLDIGVNDRNAATDPATFKAAIEQYIEDKQTDFGTLLPAQEDPMMLFIAQTDAPPSGAAPAGFPAIVQYELARDRNDVKIATPKYHLPRNASSDVHLSALGNAIKGEYYNRAFRAEFIDLIGWTETRPTAIEKSGTTIDITFQMMVEPLIFDTTNLPAATNQGFEVYEGDGSTPVSISSVTIIGDDVVRIVIATDPGTVVVRYANEGPGRTGFPGAWGNLCDSTATTSIHDETFVLRNWSVTFEETI